MSDEELIYDGINHQLYPMVEGVFLSELDVRLRGIIKQEHLNYRIMILSVIKI